MNYNIKKILMRIGLDNIAPMTPSEYKRYCDEEEHNKTMEQIQQERYDRKSEAANRTLSILYVVLFVVLFILTSYHLITSVVWN
jgi:hypothetical protein